MSETIFVLRMISRLSFNDQYYFDYFRYIFYLSVHRTGTVLVFLVFFFLDWHRMFEAFASTNPGDA